jgi:DNA-binding response OmpR family regulator
VLEAPDGAAGVVAARRHAAAIDVLCTDCMMQGLPVPQLIDQFRKLHNGRVLVCSGYAPAETGLSSEMYDDFLVKPFASDDLVRRIHALMA